MEPLNHAVVSGADLTNDRKRIMLDNPAAQRGAHREALTITAYGETQTVWAWGNDPRCKVSGAALMYRVKNFPKAMTPADAEAALCFPRKLWSFYRKYGHIQEEHLEQLNNDA